MTVWYINPATKPLPNLPHKFLTDVYMGLCISLGHKKIGFGDFKCVNEAMSVSKYSYYTVYL